MKKPIKGMPHEPLRPAKESQMKEPSKKPTKLRKFAQSMQNRIGC